MNPGNAALGRGLDVLSALAGPLAARDGMTTKLERARTK